MSTHMRERGLAITWETREALANCAQCDWRRRWTGNGAETPAIEDAKRHAETTGHVSSVTCRRMVSYAKAPPSADRRLERNQKPCLTECRA